jgi:hypothetical protein
MAIGKTGYSYVMEPPKGESTFEPNMWPAIRRAGMIADEATRKAFTTAIRSGKMSVDEANILHWHAVQSALAATAGLRYARTGKGVYKLQQIKAVHHSHIPVYDKHGVSPTYPSPEELSQEADGTFKALYAHQQQKKETPQEVTAADVDTRKMVTKGGVRTRH